MTEATSTRYPETFEGLEFEVNWGSYNVYCDNLNAVVVDWRERKIVKRFSGETAPHDADRWATDLHYAHDHDHY